MSRIVLGTERLGVLAYPPPYRSWLTISSDPDHTTLDNWQAVHACLWEELGLPFADSFFIEVKNETHPDQVNLMHHAEIVSAHPHDTMHTWGDYVCAPSHTFKRADAEAGLRHLQALACSPRIWTDHAHFEGNLMHRASVPVAPMGRDASGHLYPNHVYSLDLAFAAGVRYVWDGSLIANIWGQDRTLTRRQWYCPAGEAPLSLKRRLLPALDCVLSPLKEYLNPAIFNYARPGNRQYYIKQFADGHSLYAFPRFGRWELADIDGLATQLATQEVDKLLYAQGTAIVFTHLGKRHVRRVAEREHVTAATRAVLANLGEHHRAGHLNLSATADLLDYLVLRDHLRIAGSAVEFAADPIRFPQLSPADLCGKRFGVVARNSHFDVLLNGEPLPCQRIARGNGVFELCFE